MSTGSTFSQNEWTPKRVAAAIRIVVIILACGITLGLFATGANLYYVGAGIAAAALAITVAWQFEAALLLYVLIAFVPWGKTPALSVGGSGVGKGLYVSEVVLSFLLVIWVSKYMLAALPGNRLRSGFHIPIFAYIAYSAINVIHSFVFWDYHVNRMYQYPQVNALELGLRLLSAGAFLMVATSISNANWLRWASLAILLPGLYNLFNALIGNPIPIAAPWWPLIAILPVGYCWATVLDQRASALKRTLSAIVVGIGIYAIFVKSVLWVSGWLGLFVCLAVITLLKSRRLFVLGLCVACIAAVAFWPFIKQNVFVTSAQEGDMDRFSLLAGAVRYATTFPLGVGLGNYRSYNSFYYGDKWGTTSYTSAHGSYSQHLSEMGFPGLILLAAILLGGFRWIYRSYRTLGNEQSKTYLLATMGQIAGIAAAAFIGDYIVPTYHNGGIVTFSSTVYSWLAWGLAVAHVRIQGSQANGSAGADHKLQRTTFARPLPIVGARTH